MVVRYGEGGIRTPDKAFRPYNGLANRRLQPLGHLSNYTGLELSGFEVGAAPSVFAACLPLVGAKRLATAAAKSCSSITLYLSNMLRVRHPQSAMMLPSSTPACRKLRAAVRRRSCMTRPGQPARF